MASQQLNRSEEQEKFEQFLFEMDDIIDRLKMQTSRAGYELDDSVRSLDGLEDYYLANADSLKDPERFCNMAGRYLGEVLRSSYGGEWKLSIDDPKNMYYGQPVIVGHSKLGLEFAPISAFTRFSRKRQRGMLRAMIKNHVSPVDDLDLKPEALN